MDGDSLGRFTCWSREELPELSVHVDQPPVDNGAQQVQAEGICLGRADPSQGQEPDPPPKPGQLRPVDLGPLRVSGLAAGHLPQAAQHVRAPVYFPLLRQELKEHGQQRDQLLGRHHGRVLRGEHGCDLQPERRGERFKNFTGSWVGRIRETPGCFVFFY